MKVKTLPLAFPAQPFRYIKNSLLRRQKGTTGWMEHRPRYIWRCPEVGPRTSIGTPPRRKSQADLWTPRSRRQNDPSQHDGDPRSHRISKSRRETRSAPKSKYRSDLWTPNSLKKNSSKQPLDTDVATRTQLREAKAPSRERKNRRRSHRILSMKWSKIIGFLLVLSTFTISMLFCKHRILNATGATGTFCENRKNRESKYRSFLWATAQFRKNIERRVGHGNISKMKKSEKKGSRFCEDYYGIYDAQKKMLKKNVRRMTKVGRVSLRVKKIRHFHFRDFQWGICDKSYVQSFCRLRKQWFSVDERAQEKKCKK